MVYVLLGAVAIGLTLGLLGSGGSILTVPVLIYLAGESSKVAIAESLAIVAAISFVGAAPYAFQRSVDWRSVVLFGIPGVLGTYGGAWLSQFVSGGVQLVLFAGVMLLAAGLMFRGRAGLEDEAGKQAAWLIAIEGLGVGVLTGLVGVGGGFLIVPALVLMGGLSMRVAVGTSLLIIAAKSAAGFVKYLDVLADSSLAVDWSLIGIFAAIGIAGSLVGNRLSQRVPQAALRRAFSVFLVVMGVFILWREVPDVLAAPASVVSSSPPDSTAMSFSFMKRNTTPVRTLDPAHFLARREDDAVVIDVRTPGEVADGHVAGAEQVDFMASDFRDRVDALDRDQTYYLYCRSGNRSGKAAALMQEMGFTDVYNIGGYEALVAAGAETVR